MLCILAEVSESGYYKWLKSTESRKLKHENELADYQLIKGIFVKENETAGFRTIVMQLYQQHGLIMNHKKVIRIMRKYGLTCKIRRGRCVDNAPIETFFGHMKDEVDFNKFKTYEEVVIAINAYIYKYNHLRPQWTLKKMTPVAYRNHLLNTA